MDLTNTKQPVRKMDLTKTGTSPAVSDRQIVDSRVAKYQFALGEDAPETGELTKLVASGDEKNLRVATSTRDLQRKLEATQNLLPEGLQEATGANEGDAEYIAALMQQSAVDPSIVLESKYAENAVNTLQSMSTDQAQQAEEAVDPIAAEILYRGTEDIVTKKQIAFKLAEDWGQKTKKMSWGPYLGYSAVNMLPVLQWANFASYDEEAHWENKGTAIFNKVRQLYSLPATDFKKESEKEINRLAQFNPLDAEEFANALVSYGTSDRSLDNAFAIFNVATGATAAAGVKAVANMGKTAARMKQIAKAVNQKVTTIPDVLANAGHTEDAAEAAAREVFAKAMAPKDAPEQVVSQLADMLKVTPLLHNPKYFVTEAGALPLASTQRILDGMIANATKLNGATHTLRPATLTPEAMDIAYDAALAGYKKLYSKVSDNIMTVTRIRPEQTETGTAKIVMQWGKDGGRSAYETWTGALNAAVRQYRFKEYQIKELAPGKFVIETSADVSENNGRIYDALMTTENKSPGSIWAYSKSLMGAKEQVSNFQAEQRAVTTHGTTKIGEIIAAVARPSLEALTNKEMEALDKIMAVNRDSFRNPLDPDTRGEFYQNLSELNQAYLQHIGRAVSEKEALAYATQRQLSDFDWKIRSINAARDKIRKGAMTHEIRLPSAKTGKPEAVDIEATLLDRLPTWDASSRDDPNILIYREGESSQTVVKLSELYDKASKTPMSSEMLKDNGYIALRVYDVADRTIPDLIGFNQPVNYVVVKGSRPTPIQLHKQVPYNQGFHVEYKMPWYVKQAKFVWNAGKRIYTGDTTLIGIRTEKEGRAFLKALAFAQKLNKEETLKVSEAVKKKTTKLKTQKGKDKAKERIQKSSDAVLEAYLSKNTPWTVAEFKKIMENFDPDTPFVLTRDGRTAGDASSKTFDDKNYLTVYGPFDNLINSSHNDAASANAEFMGEKSAMLKKAVNTGTELDPIWKLEDADMFSPLNTQTRAMGRLIRSVGYEDYQIGSVMSHIAEFGDLYRHDGKSVAKEDLQRNPMFYFKNATLESPNKTLEWQAGQIKQRIEDLVGQPSQFALSMEDFRSKLAEGALGDWVPEKTIPFIKDPARYARAMVSHMKLGMFNPVQFFLQQATHANIMLISPGHGASQVPATILMRFAQKSEDPAIWDYYASLVEKTYGSTKGKYGWTSAKFKESLEGYNRSGFGIIGGEYAWRNDISDPKLFRGKVGKFLDKGYLFFNHAEQNVRMAAWNTSYSEYLTSSGKSAGSLKDADFRKILVRAQDLSGNMSRDASAFWQKGLLGSTTQYYAYTARILELLVGKRLTLAEKARLGGGLSLLYGFPVLAGATYLAQTGDWEGALTAINPFDEDLRTYALENGIPIDETTWGAINNGLASAALHLLTGQHFDVASRYSPFGADLTSNLTRNMDQHNPTLAVLITALGASGSIIRDMLTATYPIARDAYQMIGEGDTSQLVLDDFFNATREISSLNALEKILAAWNGWQYLSKKGTLISKNDDEVASLKILEAVTGLQTYGETDVFRQITAMRKNSKAQEQIKKEITKYANYYIQALQSGNEDGRRQYMNRIEAYMQLLDNQSDRTRLWGTIFSQPELRDAVYKSFSKRGSEEQRINREKQRISQ